MKKFNRLVFFLAVVAFTIGFVEGAIHKERSFLESWIAPEMVPESLKTVIEQLLSLGNSLQDSAAKMLGISEPEELDIPKESIDSSKLDVVFENQSPYRVSVFWDNDEDLQRVVNVLQTGESINMGTFPGHTFIFTREGTRDMLGEPFVISTEKSHYILPKDAKPDTNPCKDRYRQRCKNWANTGECSNNPGWMIVNCPSSCDACELLDPDKRCDPNFLNVSAENVWQPGDLNKMFERIVADEYLVNTFKISVVKQPPDDAWLLQFDNLLSEEEATVLVEWGKKLGYERSTDTGTTNERGEMTKIFSQGRTSSNTWCTSQCQDDPVVKRISDRIVNITQIPYENYEQFQLLQYELGQKYNVHHDMSPKTDKRAGGVRILTFFLYLSDVEDGGETDFPRMGVKVKPKKGRAVLWPSVLDSDPMKQDPRTYHAALPVKKGLKFAANHWIHSHNFKKANKWGCTGSFD